MGAVEADQRLMTTTAATTSCQAAHWAVHKHECRNAATHMCELSGKCSDGMEHQHKDNATSLASAAEASVGELCVLKSKLKAATALARQREGRVIGNGSHGGFRPRSEWVAFSQPQPEKAAYNTRREMPLDAARNQARLVPR